MAELQRGSRLAFQCLGDRQRHHNGLQVGEFRVRLKGYRNHVTANDGLGIFNQMIKIRWRDRGSSLRC